MDKYEKLSLCGLYCGGCKNYKENFNCMGCRNEKELVNDCPTRSCCKSKGLLHCGECEDFPCIVLKDFYNDGIRHHELAYKNMLNIKEVGVEKWLLEQEEEHTCKCGRRKLWFASKCTDEDCHISECLISQVRLPEGIFIRKFLEADFSSIKNLYKQEGWMTFINREDEALEAWKNSAITLVAVDGDAVVGLVRALTDGLITTYIAEIIVDINYRGKGIGKALLDACHGLYPNTRFDLLSTEGADDFYKNNKFRLVTGFRKSYY